MHSELNPEGFCQSTDVVGCDDLVHSLASSSQIFPHLWMLLSCSLFPLCVLLKFENEECRIPCQCCTLHLVTSLG